MTAIFWASSSFLSTLPARGATQSAPLVPYLQKNFYPRSPRGERPDILAAVAALETISIHAPHEGSDGDKGGEGVVNSLFLSTLPARGATDVSRYQGTIDWISIHAPREGSDS